MAQASLAAGDPREVTLDSAVVKVVRSIVLQQMTGPCKNAFTRDDVDDLCQTICVQLLEHMRRLAGDPAAEPIHNLPAYANVVAQRACVAVIREMNPQWLSCANRIRYAASKLPQFEIWAEDGVTLLGRTADRRLPLRGDLAAVESRLRALSASVDPARVPAMQLLPIVFQASGGPLLFDDLVDLAAQWWGRKEREIESLDKIPARGRPLRETLAGSPNDGHRALESRDFLIRLWTAIRQLPLPIRRIVLLNFEEFAGEEVAVFVPKVAGIRDLAEQMEIPALEFARMWKQLPLNDAAIAERYGLSLRQVKARRASAQQHVAALILTPGGIVK